MARAWHLCAMSILALAVGGCDGSGSGEPSSQDPAATEEGPQLPDPVSLKGAPEAGLSERLENEIELEGGPDWMVDAFGSLWVKRDDATVVRVDTGSGKALAEISGTPFKQPVCQGLGSSEDAIWACPRQGILQRIDPDTNKVVDEFEVDKALGQGRLVYAAGSLWVLTEAADELVPVDVETGKAGSSISLDGTCSDLGSDGDEIWVACGFEDRLVQVDAATGEITDEIALPGPVSVVVGEEDLFVSFDQGVAQIDRDAHEVTAVYELFPSSSGAIFQADGEAWVRDEDAHFLTHLDTESHEVIETIEAPDLPSGGDVIVVDGSVWATASDDEALVELTASD